MSEEEQTLTPKPSEESEAIPEINPFESFAEPMPIKDSVSEEKTSATPDYTTELVTSGPLSENVRVYELKDIDRLNEVQATKVEDRTKIYENSLKDIAIDQRILGTIVAINENEILVDVGFKSEGIIAREEFEEGELPKIGDQIEVFVDVLEDENGQMILSKRKADFMRIWERIKEIYAAGETVEGQIVSRIKGGMVVDIMGIDAFLPGSQIDIRPVTDFDSYIGKTFEFRIVKLNELRKNIVLSRKELLEESMKEKRDDLLSKIKVGDILTGRVKNITDFGVFIDLGGLDGLLHITDISWGRINHPREVVQMDQELTVKVIDYDQEKQRVSLGLKQLTAHPWEGVESKYPVGTIVKGKVVNITNYGVFVELEKGVEGLIHISEISWTQHIKHPSEVFKLGDEVEAKVLGIDSAERKISLGYKQLEPDPWESIEQKFTVGSIHKGIVRNLTPYGAFIELQEGVDGFAHISDMSWTKKIRHPRELLKKDDEVEFKILEISKENRKISLGLKQVTEDPWPMLETLFSVGSIVEGEVAKVTEKFIIVNLEHDLEGIIPLGQMPKKDRKDLSKAVEIGEKLQLKVLEVNRHEKKIVLSREQAIPREPKTDVEAYMMQQAETTNKLEIPTEIIQKITESEEEAKKKAEESTAKAKSPAKKTKKTENAEKSEEPAPEEEKPKKKSTKKVVSEEKPAEKEIEKESQKATELSSEETPKDSAKPTSRKAKPKAKSENPVSDDTAEK
ncbi:MAG TPA: 30S ribosomal protein S1 [Candidatus Marinimicrobia bacterium]|nr:30S ribosomal protein S1 [Candidatus Neomarinimicrobiota bacterium]HRS51651.1 30S ribosomal protein S1 [Candidatus Neomarinimicrobiota bacterium]HRU92199.1 30S ribosomal protein S1 [Candidatus Neomarinimicrobiota bacterium]